MKKLYIFIFLIFPSLLIAQTSFTSSITPDLSAYGEVTNYPGEGEYQIFLDTQTGILDKPIIVVDGFDPGDSRDIPGLYSLLDFTSSSGSQNLADLVRAEGFDVIILNFPTYLRAADGATVDGGTDFIERNAMLLVELLDIINTAKAGNSPEQNVIIGPSMGGLISRYALNYMESNGLNADTRLYMSFDSPHHGANVPIGLQHQLNFLANNGTQPIAEVQPLIDSFLKSPAARQLLVDHFEAHLQSGSSVNFDPTLTLPQAHPFRAQFENNINSFNSSGFPENTRNVAIINGSGIGNSYFALGNNGPTVTNSYTVINDSFSVPAGAFTAIVDVEIYFTPAAGITSSVSDIGISLFGFEVEGSNANSQSFSYSDGVDAAPGGLFDLAALTGDIAAGGGTAGDFVNALQIDKFNFIPSVSALALAITDNEIDWHHDINLMGRGTTNNTPFDNTFLPDENEPHVQLTENNVNFALTEILTPSLAIPDNEMLVFKLEKNPIREELVLLTENTSNANIEIIDVSGKVVYNTSIVLSNRTVLPMDLASGFYILNVTSENNTNFTTKFVAN
ncbi:T9SS type A sorting domain-containing protein [Winogradskyella aquimaris]|uniref:T9SS type A sorting domain-containing protein n=1 Tax=Winogradskyella aquimaris TaxID=864074 RepID=A0ABU5EQ88_9FLAO|nr:T9SS type A sorting domain-containing protein [Winogradskyella aquimaris]MDY2587041.1 T9SS type A sorting domain-containing protein [Winogradskyella aquimaris]